MKRKRLKRGVKPKMRLKDGKDHNQPEVAEVEAGAAEVNDNVIL